MKREEPKPTAAQRDAPQRDEPDDLQTTPTALSRQVGAKAARKLHAHHKGDQSVFFGLGMMGLVGWSIVVPTLLGVGMGVWLDGYAPGKHSWTLALLLAGLVVGCLNAWLWVTKEEQAIARSEERDDG